MTFLSFCLTGQSYQYAHTNFFSFGLYHLNQLKKEKIYIYACILINKISKKKKKVLFFSILACNTSNTKWLIYSLSQHLTSLANDFPNFFASPVKVTNRLLLFFSILAFNTTNT